MTTPPLLTDLSSVHVEARDRGLDLEPTVDEPRPSSDAAPDWRSLVLVAPDVLLTPSSSSTSRSLPGAKLIRGASSSSEFHGDSTSKT
jgi:hypothetical protein